MRIPFIIKAAAGSAGSIAVGLGLFSVYSSTNERLVLNEMKKLEAEEKMKR